jgi:L-lactate dehydrogenase complex protein LldG
LTRPGENLGAIFTSRATAAGMIVHRCNLAELGATVQIVLKSVGVSRVVLDHLEPALAFPIAAALAQATLNIIDPLAAGNLDPQFDADAGITGVLTAIAETGTLVLTPGPQRSRGAFIIPPVHVAIVPESKLIADMIDLWPLVGSHPPTALTLITGPSKTADIEGILVTGVHGPRAVHIMLVAGELGSV